MRLLRLAPWRRGPVLLARRPGVALALFAAALVAALPAAAALMFLSSAQHATLHRQIDETCLSLVGPSFAGYISPPNPYDFRGVLHEDSVVGRQRYEQRVAALADHSVAGLAPPVSTGLAYVDAELVDRPLANPDLTGLGLLARPGFEHEVEVLDGPAGTGLWLPHEHAQQQGIEVGDQLTLTHRFPDPGVWTTDQLDEPDAEPITVTLPVAAIYRDLRTVPTTPYWCAVESVYAGSSSDQADPDAVILPTALVDSETLLATGEQARLAVDQLIELAPTDPDPTAPAAARLVADSEALRAAMYADHPQLFPTDRFDDTRFYSELPRYERRAELVRTGLLPPVLPITAAGTLVGLAVAGAAAVFWVERRRQELAVLSVHGVGTGALGVKAVVEALPAVAAGAAAGWATAWALVAGVGPSQVLAPGTPAMAGAAAAAVGAVALLLIGGLAAAGARGLADTRPVSRGVAWWRRVPWELALVAAAPAAWLLFAGDEVADPEAGGVGTVVHVPARLLVAPILVIGGLAVFAARLTAGRLRASGLARTPRGPARLLAWRRSVRLAVTTAILAAATAVPVAMAIFGATATDSIRTTADAQLRYSLGSDTVIGYGREVDRQADGLPAVVAPASMAGRSTEVLRLQQQHLDGLIVDVLAVDPETFTAGAFWDGRIPGDGLDQAVAQLSAGDTPVVVASRRIPPGPATLTIRDEDLPVMVGDTRPLPGAQPSYPLILVDRDAIERHLSGQAFESFTLELWIAGEPETTLAQLADAGLPAGRVSTIDDQRRGALYEPVTYTFQYLIALSIFTGLIGVVGLLLHLESRTAAHRRAYVMLRRLGLRPAAHRRALLLEVGVPVVAGLLAGLAGAAGLAYGLRSGFDLDPGLFPAAVVAWPGPMAAAVCGAALAIATAASLLAHARIARAHPAEVLRDTT
jgi:putative ABC transport system permease protein